VNYTATNQLADWRQIAARYSRILLVLVALSLFLGIAPLSFGQPLAPLTNPKTALREYVRAPDEQFHFEITDVDRKPLFRRYTIRMQSQVWNPGGLVVNHPLWEHGVALFVPRFITTDTGLLFIAGGSNDEELIGDDEAKIAQRVALLTGSAVAVVFQVTQPAAPVLR